MNKTVGLLPHEYETVVAPCLQVAAEIAASRNDPTLYNDLACMLMLRGLVRGLTQCYRADVVAIGQMSAESIFAQAPDAACAMVLEEFDVQAQHIPVMLDALSRAETLLQQDETLIRHQGIIEQAYMDLKNDRHDRGMNALVTAASLIVAAIDDWEKERSS